jgi:hypothetical protein
MRRRDGPTHRPTCCSSSRAADAPGSRAVPWRSLGSRVGSRADRVGGEAAGREGCVPPGCRPLLVFRQHPRGAAPGAHELEFRSLFATSLRSVQYDGSRPLIRSQAPTTPGCTFVGPRALYHLCRTSRLSAEGVHSTRYFGTCLAAYGRMSTGRTQGSMRVDTVWTPPRLNGRPPKRAAVGSTWIQELVKDLLLVHLTVEAAGARSIEVDQIHDAPLPLLRIVWPVVQS